MHTYSIAITPTIMNKFPDTPDEQAVSQDAEIPAKTLDEVFRSLLKDLYCAETSLIDIMNEMSESAHNIGLKDAFSVHSRQSKQHIERLEKVFQRIESS